jgi:hypothetical protein
VTTTMKVAQAALHAAWDANPDCPGQLYGKEAQALTEAAVSAYLAATSERERVLMEALEPFARLGDLLREFAAFSGRDLSGFYVRAFDRARSAMSIAMNSEPQP